MSGRLPGKNEVDYFSSRGRQSMNQSNVVSIAAALGLAVLLTACGGGGGNNNQNAGNNAGTGGGNKGSQQVKQMNPLHVAHNEMAGHSLQINMGQQNNSGQAGNASVTDAKGGANVTINLEKEPKGASEPAHIHQGTCAKLDPAPWKPLTSVVDGKSFTHIPGLTVAQIKKGKYAINVHKSANDLKTYVSCGDLVL
jgi:hypothetical protein